MSLFSNILLEGGSLKKNYYDFDLTENKGKKKRKKLLQSMIAFLIEVLLVIALAFFLVLFSIEKTHMDGASMEPTLKAEQKLLVNKLSYVFGAPKRFDVVVFELGTKEHDYYHIKRIIGLPGETVQIINGIVYIDGKVLPERISNLPSIHLSGLATEPMMLDEDEYFVLGDNRNNSEDSRFATIGNITKKQILGKAFFALDPFSFLSGNKKR